MTAARAWRGDVVVVGGGIAGCALATVLARAGVEVLVLERQRRYRDRVRGEIFVSWGVAELRSLGLDGVLLATPGGSYATEGVLYDEIAGQRAAPADSASLVDIIPGVPGHLAVGHPEACAALSRAAVAAGATLRTGVDAVEVTAGLRPEVRYTADGGRRRALARLVVGADGGGSAVRRQLGIPLSVETSGITGCGLLVSDLAGWPLQRVAAGTEGDLHFQVFPRGDGHARLYLYHDRRQRLRFAGPDGARRFLDAFAFRAVPDSGRITGARIAGPCRSYAMSHATAPCLHGPGAVLVGDAAGWSDPIIGQGLSVAMRDVRLVAEALLATRDWATARLFEAYTGERRERMRRLRMSARLRTAIHCTFTPGGVERRRRWYRRWPDEPVLGGLELAVLVGPERPPVEAFTDATLSEALALAG